MKAFAEYFEGKVEKITEVKEEVITKKVVKTGWFRKEVTIEKSEIFHPYALCSLTGTRFLLNIPVVEGYGSINVGDTVSIHLKCEYEFSCFHYNKPPEKPKEIEVN